MHQFDNLQLDPLSTENSYPRIIRRLLESLDELESLEKAIRNPTRGWHWYALPMQLISECVFFHFPIS